MMTSFYNLLKYAQTGIASPDMTYYDKIRASTLMGGAAVQTLTGIPPLSFPSDGSPITIWSMKGNGSQTGTPTPDNPVMPTFCGVRTANVMPAGEKKTITSNGITVESDGCGRYHVYGTSTADASAKFSLISGFAAPISVSNGGQGTLSFFNTHAVGNVRFIFCNGEAHVDDWGLTPMNRTHAAYSALGNKYVDSVAITVSTGTTVDMIISPEFTNDGVLPTEFEPYGYKIPITCAGQTTPVYLGEVPTVRRVRKMVLTGTEQWSLWSSGQPDVERYYYKWGKSTPSGYGLICTHLPFRTTDGNFEHIRLGGSCRDDFVIYISKTIASTVTDFKAYLAAQYQAGTPVTVWYVLATPETGISNEPLAKIGDYADELHSEDAGVTIPTVKGANVLTVDTTLQPSEMSITYRG